MKTRLKALIVIVTVLFLSGIPNTYAQTVSPTTPDVVLLPAELPDYDLGKSPATGTNPRWVVRHSPSPIDVKTIGSVSPISITGNIIPAANLNTGYLYISTTSNESCESLPTIIPIYRLPSSKIEILNAYDYCEGYPNRFTTSLSNKISNKLYLYQWYTVVGDKEIPIKDAPASYYQPPVHLPAGTKIKYRVKVGYTGPRSEIIILRSQDKEVTVKEKPSKPNITIKGVKPEKW